MKRLLSCGCYLIDDECVIWCDRHRDEFCGSKQMVIIRTSY